MILIVNELKIQIDLGRIMTVTYHRKQPCGRCPYKLGLIRTLANPVCNVSGQATVHMKSLYSKSRGVLMNDSKKMVRVQRVSILEEVK